MIRGCRNNRIEMIGIDASQKQNHQRRGLRRITPYRIQTTSVPTMSTMTWLVIQSLNQDPQRCTERPNLSSIDWSQMLAGKLSTETVNNNSGAKISTCTK